MEDAELIELIFDNLKSGKKYQTFHSWDYYRGKPIDYPYFETVLYYNSFTGLFHWGHYGSSANHATKKDLQWIIENIFDTTPTQFIQNYILND